jgi:hypothetical protein
MRLKKQEVYMRQTNGDLRRYYAEANAAYFHNALPKDIPMRFHKMRDVGTTRIDDNGVPVEIWITEKLRTFQAMTIEVVLHEMLHVEKPLCKGHGWRFDRRMLRLAKQGAFSGLW